MLPNSVPNPHCPFCLSQRTHLWFNKKTDQGEFPIWTCQHCKGGYVYPRPAQDSLDNFYCSLKYRSTNVPSAMQLNWLLADEHRYPNSTEDAKRIVCHLQQHFGLRPGTLFFDAGAGYGFFSFAALQAGFKVQACEPDPSCRAVFSELTGFEADPEMFNPSIAARYAGRFEVFLMSQVLEHITILDETLKLIHQILKEGGIAVIAVPHFKSFISILQGKKDMFIIPPEHLNFFSKAGLISLFSRHNFTVLRLETISRFPPDSIHKIISVKSIAKLGVPFLKSIFCITDTIGLGMYINCYFKKER